MGSAITHKRRPTGTTPAGAATGGVTPVSDAPIPDSALHGAARAHDPAPAPAKTPRPTSNPLTTVGRHIPLPLPVPDWSKPIILVLLALALWFGVRAWVTGRRARRLEAQRARLLADIDAMQAALVPEVPERIEGVVVSVAYRPAEGPGCGGDFYDLFAIGPGRVAIILGDVSGHGRQALSDAAHARYTLRAYLQAGLQPRSALALAGRVLEDSLKDRFATVVVGVYDIHESTLTFALAGHPPPILRGCESWEPVIACSAPPLGCGVATGQRQSVVSLPDGVQACFFSDGLIEARCAQALATGAREEGAGGGRRGAEPGRKAPELLGRERLCELLDGLAERPVGGPPSAADLLAAVRSVAQATPDDMAACILAPPVAVRDSHVHIEELQASEWMLKTGRAERFLRACGVSALQAARAVELAEAVAGEASGTALLRVERSPAGASVAVDQPSADQSYLTAVNMSDPNTADALVA
jgi:hypothetical protein